MLFEPRLEGVVVVARLLKPDSNSYRITDRISPGQSNCEALKARFGQRKLERCGDNFSPEVADQAAAFSLPTSIAPASKRCRSVS